MPKKVRTSATKQLTCDCPETEPLPGQQFSPKWLFEHRMPPTTFALFLSATAFGTCAYLCIAHS